MRKALRVVCNAIIIAVGLYFLYFTLANGISNIFDGIKASSTNGGQIIGGVAEILFLAPTIAMVTMVLLLGPMAVSVLRKVLKASVFHAKKKADAEVYKITTLP